MKEHANAALNALNQAVSHIRRIEADHLQVARAALAEGKLGAILWLGDLISEICLGSVDDDRWSMVLDLFPGGTIRRTTFAEDDIEYLAGKSVEVYSVGLVEGREHPRLRVQRRAPTAATPLATEAL